MLKNIEIEEERDNPQFLDKIKENILGLPKNSLFLLKDVINLMVLVTRNSEFNKMSTQVSYLLIIILYHIDIFINHSQVYLDHIMMRVLEI